jgi:hypothetical protein
VPLEDGTGDQPLAACRVVVVQAVEHLPAELGAVRFGERVVQLPVAVHLQPLPVRLRSVDGEVDLGEMSPATICPADPRASTSARVIAPRPAPMSSTRASAAGSAHDTSRRPSVA